MIIARAIRDIPARSGNRVFAGEVIQAGIDEDPEGLFLASVHTPLRAVNLERFAIPMGSIVSVDRPENDTRYVITAVHQ
jgi:hypothetical protein